jgi:hypothetical protein
MRAARAIVTSLAVVTILAVPACRKKAGGEAAPPEVVPRLGAVAVQDLTAPEAIPAAARIDVKALTGELQSRLAGSGLFAPGGPDAGGDTPVARVRAELAMEDVQAEGKAAARAMVRFRVDTRPASVAAQHWNEDVQAGAETTYAPSPTTDQKAVFAKLASRAVADLASAYVGRQRLWRGNAAEVHSALTADGGELQVEAIHAIADRKLTSEVPTLLKLLSNDDEGIRDAALGALVELKERRAVGEIAKQRSMRDRREMRKILDAIATLGGQEAEEYLSFVADAHEDEEIRQMAKQALVRLKRRAPPPAK